MKTIIIILPTTNPSIPLQKHTTTTPTTIIIPTQTPPTNKSPQKPSIPTHLSLHRPQVYDFGEEPFTCNSLTLKENHDL
jgi:hypothetical protein